MNCNDKKITRFISDRLPKDDSMESVNNYLENKNRIPFPAPPIRQNLKNNSFRCVRAHEP